MKTEACCLTVDGQKQNLLSVVLHVVLWELEPLVDSAWEFFSFVK